MSTIDAVRIEVTDLERSLAFYRLIGVAIPETTSRSFATTVAVPARIDWSTVPGGTSGKRIVMGVRCRDADDVDRIHLALVEAGHKVQAAPHVEPWGALVCRAVDPDGNVVELYVALP